MGSHTGKGEVCEELGTMMMNVCYLQDREDSVVRYWGCWEGDINCGGL